MGAMTTSRRGVPSEHAVIFARRRGARWANRCNRWMLDAACCRWAPDRLHSSGSRAPVMLLAGFVGGAKATANDTRRYGPIA